ncbi:SH2 domain-containing protein 2A [Myotis brandtii]|uniref:SH2 domain-containing protein 2A n=1 Tax=Myotis brandtii TaxID=109478 RepID=S7MVR7_MYOBR|nr:SH2 domain-containing protein 2A [Myotis brandtii]
MELPLAQISPQGSHNTPPPTFTTFQPLDFTRKSCQGLLKETRLQALQAGEAPFSPRAPDVHAAALGAASSQEDTGKAEEVPKEGGQSLQAETRAWFQKTQARGLLQRGAAPPWFHGFITRREAERLLETKPQGCYLVRFSESAVTFVLTYRTEEADAASKSQDSHPQYSPVLKKEKPRALTQKEGGSEPKEPSQPPRPKPPVPAKPLLSSEAYTSPAPRLCRTLPAKPSNPIYHEPDEPIAFYAMGRGSPGEAPSNIYAEVEVEMEVPSGVSKLDPCVAQLPRLYGPVNTLELCPSPSKICQRLGPISDILHPSSLCPLVVAACQL